jgi:MFS family permease
VQSAGKTQTGSGDLSGWTHGTIVSVSVLAAAAGLAQFAVTATLPDVAAAYGEAQPPGVAAEQAILSGTTLGVGLAIVRLASLAALPLAGLADSWGRRRVMLVSLTVGLVLTSAAGLSPSFWVLVAILALGRPLLSATNAVAIVVAAESTTSSERSKAIALVSAAYAVGSGVIVVLRGIILDHVGFRALFGLVALPLLAIPLLRRHFQEPARFIRQTRRCPHARLGAIPPRLRGRVALLFVLTGAAAIVSGAANTFVFLYGEGVLGVSAATMAIVVLGAGPAALMGLVVGRWAADRFGRRITAGTALSLVALAGIVTYALGPIGLMAGYIFGLLAGGTYAPASASLSTELFPTSVRATVSGWLAAAGVVGAAAGIALVGVLADVAGYGRASTIVFLPIVVTAGLYSLLPETRGLELEESAAEEP